MLGIETKRPIWLHQINHFNLKAFVDLCILKTINGKIKHHQASVPGSRSASHILFSTINLDLPLLPITGAIATRIHAISLGQTYDGKVQIFGKTALRMHIQ